MRARCWTSICGVFLPMSWTRQTYMAALLAQQLTVGTCYRAAALLDKDKAVPGRMSSAIFVWQTILSPSASWTTS